jgi:hypothetical protein
LVHLESHAALLGDFSEGAPRPIDAVIVPAGRPVNHLRFAAGLADELSTELVLMCWRGGADAAAFAEQALREHPDLSWHALHIPEDHRSTFLPPTASTPPDTRDWRHGPLSTKRNLALILARTAGWRTILLIDDDIEEITAELAQTAANRLGSAAAIGITIANWPDNSVVCHANRITGGQQDVFVGAPALVLDVNADLTFFPRVYNEDWLFSYDLLSAGQVGRIDRASQLRYDPFADLRRAEAEEFGDLVAEGLMASLHDSWSSRPPSDASYWRDFITARHVFIDRIRNRSTQDPASAGQEIRESLTAAQQRLGTITPEACASFVIRWRHDVQCWRARFDSIVTASDLPAAATSLGLTLRSRSIVSHLAR